LMKIINRLYILFFFATAGIGAAQFYSAEAQAQSSYFSGRGCTDCHSTPTAATCAGCHHHSGTLTATANKTTSYAPGETVTVTLAASGARSGWIGARLYDQTGAEIARSTGSQSGMGGSTLYPATLSAPAPATAGTYTWRMAYLGNQDGTGSGDVHAEKSVNVSITVAAPVDAVAPAVNTFTMQATASSLTVPVTAFTASDATGVTGYMITTSAIAPTAATAGWSATPPTTATAGAAGSITFYAWAMDAAGNISTSLSAGTTITLVTQNQLSVTLSGAGSVNSSIAGIACTSGICTASYDSTASVILTETPGGSSTFAGWGGDCSSFGTATTCTVSMAAARYVTATFNSSAEAMIGPTPYSNLTAAYSAAASGATIMLMESNITADLTVNKDIVLDGGYNASFTAKTGQPTTLSGVVTVSAGSMTVDGLAIM
jgi:hypothetical protein